MLVLSRRPKETVLLQVGDIEIRVTVVRIGPGTARLAFTAPPQVNIVREELTEGEASGQQEPDNRD